MKYTSLKQVKDSDSVLPEGIEFFIEHPMEFIQLVKDNHVLAKKFADQFTSEEVERMLCTAYNKPYDDSLLSSFLTKISGSPNKFFSQLLELNTNTHTITFHNTATLLQMQQGIWSKGLSLYDTNKYCPKYINRYTTDSGQTLPFVYVYTSSSGWHTPIFWCLKATNPLTDLSNVAVYTPHLNTTYTQAFEKEKLISVVINISKTLLKKLKTPFILDTEFAQEAIGTNRIMPALAPALKANLKVETYSLLALVFRFVSTKILLSELAKTESENPDNYFKRIIQAMPMSKKAYAPIYQALSDIAAGPKGAHNLRLILDTFNFDVLEALEKVKSKTPYALQFYQLGEICKQNRTQRNLMLDKYPRTAPKYPEQIPEPKFEIIDAQVLQIPASAPPALTTTPLIHTNIYNKVPSVVPSAPPPAYNEKSDVYIVMTEREALITQQAKELAALNLKLQSGQDIYPKFK